MIHDYRWYIVGTILLLVYDEIYIVKWLWDCAPQVTAGIFDADHPTKIDRFTGFDPPPNRTLCTLHNSIVGI